MINVADAALLADFTGALYWPDESLLAVADLHLEKGSSFAARGMLLPPYDTATTLARLGELVARYAPRLVVALGDSFHDGQAPLRIAAADRAAILALQQRRDWVWIAGNHDPEPAAGVGGVFTKTLTLGALTFRHEPTAGDAHGQIAGHLHPLARVSTRGRTISRRCFVTDKRRLVMPALGAYTGGLNVRDRAFARLFGSLNFTAHMLGERRLFSMTAGRCMADAT